MEGVSHEAASLAGHLGLDRLVCVFDDNRITIDGDTDLAASDDVAARFRAYGWDVAELGEIGEDLDALESALEAARTPNGKPRLLVLRTHIGFPSPDHTDSHAAHGLAFRLRTSLERRRSWESPMSRSTFQQISSSRTKR